MSDNGRGGEGVFFFWPVIKELNLYISFLLTEPGQLTTILPVFLI